MAQTHEPLTEQLLDGSFPFDDPFPLYSRLRDEAPVAWCEDPGFWAVSRHADVMAVAADPATFCSGRGILVSEIGTEYPSPPTIMHTDPPEHTAYRSLVQAPFARKATESVADNVRQRAALLIDALPRDEPVDVVEALSVPLPIQVIADVLGLPESDHPKIFEWSEAAIPGATEMTDDEKMAAMGEMTVHLIDQAAARRSSGGDGLIAQLVTAELDGRSLDDLELAMFLIQLLVAGNETTRNMISAGLVGLADRPDQWQRLVDDQSMISSAVEELLRWTTPVISFMRTATVDTQIGDQPIAAGDHVLLVYASADRDPAVFGATAGEIDVTRSPNHHVAFGFGAHFCLGARLARLEGAAVLETLIDRGLRPEPGGRVTRSPSSVIAGVKSAPLVFRSGATDS
jgi:cytochrome P450